MSAQERAATPHEGGFSLVELLVALVICALISGAMAGVAAPARTAFERTPEAIDLQRRGRAAIDAVVQSLRSAGANVAVTHELGPLSELVPAVVLSDQDPGTGHFTRMLVVTPRPHAAQGVLSQDQDGPSGSLLLAEACPDAADVCGFLRGMPAVIADGTGRFDVLVVGATQPAARRLTPEDAFTRPYGAGSIVVEADALVFRLDEHALVRETAGGAVQPIVDGVDAVFFRAPGIEPNVLIDGPWWEGPEGEFDDDWFRVRSVDVTVRLGARDFHATVSLRNVR